MNQFYGTGAILAVGVIGGLGYYIYQTKKGGQGASTSGEQPSNPQQNKPKPRPQTNNKFEMD